MALWPQGKTLCASGAIVLLVRSSVVKSGQATQIIGRLMIVSAAVAVYALALHWAYVNLITDRFAYLGYTYSEPALETAALTYGSAVLAAWVLPARLRRPSDLILWILFIVAVAPSILVPIYTDYQPATESWLSGLYFASAFMLAALIARRNSSQPMRPLIKSMSPKVFWLVVGAYTALVYALLHFTLGLSLNFVGLLDVYDQREEYRQGLAGTTALVGYLVSTQANVVNPLIIAGGLARRQWTVVALGVLGQAVLYSGTGFKTILFSVPTIVLIALLMRGGRRPRTIWLLLGGVVLIAAAAIVDQLQGDILWTSLFTRRFLLTPGVLTAAYLEFYSYNPFAMLSYSVLEGFTRDHYGTPPARVIGYMLTANPNTAANANFFADGYANFGFTGVAAAAVILGVYLRVLDRASDGLPVGVTVLIVVMPAVALSNTSILTAMLSHGLVAAVALLALAPRSDRAWNPSGAHSLQYRRYKSPRSWHAGA